MTRPDEIAALADRIVRHTQELACQPLCMTMGDWSQLSNDLLATADALRLSATSPGDAVRENNRKIALEFCQQSFQKSFGLTDARTLEYADCLAELLDTATDYTALAPAEKAGDEPQMPEAAKAQSLKTDWCPTCHRGWNLYQRPATPTPPSADVEDETKCECGFLASACRTNPCYRKKTATSGLVPNAKYPDLGHLPATRAVSEIDAELLDTKNKIIALIREGFDPEPNDWPRHRGWDDGAGEIAEKIIAVFQHSGGETTQTVETCPRCNLKADSLLHKFCTHSQCPIRSSLIQSAAPGSGTEGGVA